MAYKILVIGASAGGVEALKILFEKLKFPIGVPIIVIQHLKPDVVSYLPEILERAAGVKAFEAEDKMVVMNDCIYTPAPNYHLFFEKDYTLTLTIDERVSFARPSIDLTFESVCDAFKNEVIGVLLTGANHDGAKGMCCIEHHGGYTIVQDPREAYANEMPKAALKMMKPSAVLPIEKIAEHIQCLLAVEEEGIR